MSGRIENRTGLDEEAELFATEELPGRQGISRVAQCLLW